MMKKINKKVKGDDQLKAEAAASLAKKKKKIGGAARDDGPELEEIIDGLKNDLVWKENDFKEARDYRDRLKMENEKLKRML